MKTALSALSVCTCLLLFSAAPTFAQDSSKEERKAEKQADRPPGVETERRSFDPEAMKARMLENARTQLEVESDEEWALISERLVKVSELRRAQMSSQFSGASMFSGRGGDRGGDRGSSRGGRSSSNPDVSALADAIKNKAPAAEIKARLDVLRENRKKADAQLAQAQEDLRAVLTVRQEAMLVAAGLLP
jgi:hypothetical protein